ncbi:YdcF family protein [Paenibacillus xanthanilyticus]|uniref:YdcF family protein n=1 Tax=Paenibacillus xanthanilyticus TaxID=1783531 RepID=A0ABV8K1C3_9BACL
MWNLRNRFFQWSLRIIALAAAAMLAFSAYSAYAIWTYGETNERVRADAAVVLGAAAWGDEPSPVLRERVNHAILLYKEGYAKLLIFTGGRAAADNQAESEVARSYAIRQGVPASAIRIETQSTITEQNMSYAYELGVQEGVRSWTIVSDPLHMKRAMIMAKHAGMEEVYASPTQTSAYQSTKSKLPFLLREVFYYTGYRITLPVRRALGYGL